MAAYLKITQGTVEQRSINAELEPDFQFVNTSIKDEHILIKRCFLPLLTKREQFTNDEDRRFNQILTRFFDRGMFLFKNQYDFLNETLERYGFDPVSLPDDGCYFQPKEKGKKSPSAKSWSDNGAARYQELEDVIFAYKQSASKLDEQPTAKTQPTMADKLADLI